MITDIPKWAFALIMDTNKGTPIIERRNDGIIWIEQNVVVAAIIAARRAGQEEMRKRAAHVARVTSEFYSEHYQGSAAYNGQQAARDCEQGILALPLDEVEGESFAS